MNLIEIEKAIYDAVGKAAKDKKESIEIPNKIAVEQCTIMQKLKELVEVVN